jgi:hypothetical protein
MILFSLGLVLLFLTEVALNFLSSKFSETSTSLQLAIRIALYLGILFTPAPSHPIAVTFAAVIALSFIYNLVIYREINLIKRIALGFNREHFASHLYSPIAIPVVVTVLASAIQCYANFEEYILEEIDTLIDAIIIAILISVWIVQDKATRYNR